MILCFFLASCSDNCSKECQRAHYNNGYESGKIAGYKNGFKEGEEEGYEDGYLSGTKSYVSDSFLPSLGASIIFAVFIILFLAFNRFFNKSIGQSVNDFVLGLHNLFLYFTLKRKAISLEKQQMQRAKIVSKTSALELHCELHSILAEMEYENEFCLILSKIEEYLTEFQIYSYSKVTEKIKGLADSTLVSNSLTPKERNKLLLTINIILNSNLSKNQNLMKYEKSSYSKIYKVCNNFIKHRKSYVFSFKIKKYIFLISVLINILIIVSVFLYLKEPVLFNSIFTFIIDSASSLIKEIEYIYEHGLNT